MIQALQFRPALAPAPRLPGSALAADACLLMNTSDGRPRHHRYLNCPQMPCRSPVADGQGRMRLGPFRRRYFALHTMQITLHNIWKARSKTPPVNKKYNHRQMPHVWGCKKQMCKLVLMCTLECMPLIRWIVARAPQRRKTPDISRGVH